jgi:hypothetical protein
MRMRMRMKIIKFSILRIAVPVVLILSLFNFRVIGQYDENVIKAAYIERITRFVEWPDKNKLSESSFIIGVYGDNDFYSTLIRVFNEKPIKDLFVKVISIKTPEQVSTCNLCYISKKAGPVLKKFVNAANSSGVLLISESTEFGKEGVHINFYLDDEKLKFEINEKSINSAGFKVSYLLMQNTRIIK